MSAAEVMILAAALGVPPAELLCPAGYDEQVEMLPGRMMDPAAAARWLCGELKLEVTGSVTTLRWPGVEDESNLHLLNEYDQFVRSWQASRTHVAEAAANAREAGDERLRAAALTIADGAAAAGDMAVRSLRRIRAEMRRRGMILPPAPQGLDLGDDGPSHEAAAHSQHASSGDVT